MSNQIDDVLKRYLKIQKEEQLLKEEKAELQGILAEHMKQIGKSQWFPDQEGQKLKINFRESTVVEYDEELLQKRLNDRYKSILEPDIRKIKKNLSRISNLLESVLDQIGSPTSDKVKSGIESGIISKDEFVGAFSKTVKRNVSVSRILKKF